MIWCDWGRAMEIGAETCAPEIADITFEDCDIVRTTHIAMDIQHGDRAAVRDIRFENIRVEIDDQNPPPRMQQNRDEKYPADAQDGYCPTLLEIVIRKNFYSQDEERGTVRDIVFQDIAVLEPPAAAVVVPRFRRRARGRRRDDPEPAVQRPSDPRCRRGPPDRRPPRARRAIRSTGCRR